MAKKLFLMALAACFVVAAPAFADNACTTANPALQVVMVGSSAQFNATAYGAKQLITGAGGTFNLFSVKGKDTSGTPSAQIIDSRISSNPSDSATLWVAWDGGSPCKVWVYFSVDSAVGVKDFLAWGKVGTKSAAFAYGQLSTLMSGDPATWCGSGCTQNKVFGLTDTNLVNAKDELPASIITALNAIPSNQTSGNPPTYCGGGTLNSDVYCYFNAAATDIRPEDALYGTTRALAAYDTKALNGLGYDSTACGGDGTGEFGCPIYTSMATGSKFYVVNFKLVGSDPISLGTIPAFTTIPTGISPVVVFVNNADSSGFGTGAPSYAYTNINRMILSQVFQGNLSRTTDLLTSGAAIPGAGKPIQVVQREPLSGTYNTFEFTGVRTLSGSAATPAVKSTNNILSNAFGGQELGIIPSGDSTHFNYLTDPTNCPTASGSAPTGVVTCVDPLFVPTASGGVRLRAIGTGEEVPGVVGGNAGQPATPNGIGYAFWSFGNLKPASGGKAHYLTVDGVDPLFASPTDGTNTAGAYNFPTCSATPCTQVIPFTHVVDGSYPLWSLLRIITFSGTKKPPAVATLVNAELAQASTGGLYDFVPLTDGSNNLTVFVSRSHYKQSSINPANGHKGCTSLHPLTGCAAEGGGDMGGSVITVQADIDYLADFGSEIIGDRQ